MEYGTQEQNSEISSKKPRIEKLERAAKKVTGNRSDKVNCPTSVAFTQDEKLSIKTMADKHHISTSDLIRRGVRLVLGNKKEFSPPSIGVVDGVYAATVHDDVVALSNSLSTLAYAVGALDQHLTRAKRVHVRLLLREAISELQAIAGRVNAHQNHLAHGK